MKCFVVERAEIILDFMLITVLTALAVGLAFHPFFFGDELVSYRFAGQPGASLLLVFHELNQYKPRLFFNYIQAILAVTNAPRYMHAVIVAACLVWINGLMYGVLRLLCNASRSISWLVVAAVLSSRYGIMFYYDYLSGMIELLATALFLTCILFTWLAWKSEKFNFSFIVLSTIFAFFCVLTHERYAVGLITAGCAIAGAELFGNNGKRRTGIICWALLLGSLPLIVFAILNKIVGVMPLATGTAGTLVQFRMDTIWSAITYSYDAFLGGNYGHVWFWGLLNYQHPIGKILGPATAVCTLVLLGIIIWYKGFVWQNRWLGLACLMVALSLISIASLTGTDLQAARFIYPTGICILVLSIVMLKNPWRYAAICLPLSINCIYLFSGSVDYISSIYSSRAANSIASALMSIDPNGRNGIVVGNNDNSWTIGGGALGNLDARPGDTFSRLNLASGVHIDPILSDQKTIPSKVDFGLIFTGFGPHRTALYRLVTPTAAMISANIYDVNQLPTQLSLGSDSTWKNWQWNSTFQLVDDAVSLRPELVGWLSQPVSALDGRFLVYEARAKDVGKAPMRLQVNWNAKKDNRFISTQIQVVYPSETWHSYSIYLVAPPGAEVGYVYANLHDDAHGEVELKSVELK